MVFMTMQSKQTAAGRVTVADTARVTGQVELGEDVNLWYGAAIRGDVAKVTIGRGSNVQDNATVHCDSGLPNTIGKYVSIGHNAVVHGRSVGDGTLIGMHATVMGDTVIGKRCLIAAGALVPPGLEVPDDYVVMGTPGRVIRKTREKEREYLGWLAKHYVELSSRYVDSPDDPTVRPVF
jgi:carbonic anhydrase/acetyltransferase-like protein (isoleucine patch superfamily)